MQYGQQIKTNVSGVFRSNSMNDYEAALKEFKKDKFFSMSHHRSYDPDLRNRGQVRILEIGRGANDGSFEFYPSDYTLTVVERNAFFEPLFYKNKDKFPGMKTEKFVTGTIENMEGVQDRHIDVVVATLVLCTATNVEKALNEIIRVLAPGGKFYYWEHVTDRSETWLNALQKKLAQIWLHLFDYHLNQDVDVVIEAHNGFSVVKQRRFDIASQQGVFKLIKVHVMGVATKWTMKLIHVNIHVYFF